MAHADKTVALSVEKELRIAFSESFQESPHMAHELYAVLTSGRMYRETDPAVKVKFTQKHAREIISSLGGKISLVRAKEVRTLSLDLQSLLNWLGYGVEQIVQDTAEEALISKEKNQGWRLTPLAAMNIFCAFMWYSISWIRLENGETGFAMLSLLCALCWTVVAVGNGLKK